MEKLLKIKSFIINKFLFNLKKKNDEALKKPSKEGKKRSQEATRSSLNIYSNTYNDISNNISYLTPNSFHFISYRFIENETPKNVKPPKIVKVPKRVIFDAVEEDFKKEMNTCFPKNSAQRQTINAVLNKRFLKSKQLKQNSLQLLQYRELHMHRTSELSQKPFHDELMDIVFSERPKVNEYSQHTQAAIKKKQMNTFCTNIILKPNYSITLKATQHFPILTENTLKEQAQDDTVDRLNDTISKQGKFQKPTLLKKVFFLLFNIFGSNREKKTEQFN